MNLAVKLPPLAPGEFRFTTKALMPGDPSADGRRRFRTVASSTIRDMQGDEMKVSALEDMAAAFRKGVPFFLKQYGSNAWFLGQSLTLKDSHGGDMAEWLPELRVRECPETYGVLV